MKKKAIAILSTVLVFMMTLLITFSSCGDKVIHEVSKYVSHSFALGLDGTFKILQITDMHLINSTRTNKDLAKDYSKRDEWAMTAVTSIVEAASPDLIVVTGDSIFTLDTIKMFTLTNDNYEAFQKFAKFIDAFKIPWLFVFGNHDEEGSLRTRMGSPAAAKKVLGDYMKSDELKYCLYENGPEELTGLGNYIVNVLNKDGSVNQSLVMMDSGSYLMVEKDGKQYADQRRYEYVHDDQLDWYESAIQDISRIEGKKVSSIVFQHIPFPEYATVVNSYIDSLTALGEDWHNTIKADGTSRTLDTAIGEITYHGGVYNEGEVCCSYIGEFMGNTYDGGHEFERLLKVGSTKYVFCGHDHRNTFSFTYKGIRMSYGMSIDYSANGIVPPPVAYNQTIFDEVEQRGGTLITLKENSEVDVRQIPFTRNLYREELAARG